MRFCLYPFGGAWLHLLTTTDGPNSYAGWLELVSETVGPNFSVVGLRLLATAVGAKSQCLKPCCLYAVTNSSVSYIRGTELL